MATPREPQQFIALKNPIPDEEARAQFARDYSKPLAPSKGIPLDVEELRRKVLDLDTKIGSVISLRSEDFRRRWNPMIDRVELEVGDIRDSNPKTNYVQNGGFRQWNAAITLPTGWTATNAPTISRVTARTGTQGGNYACRIAAGGSAGSISRTARVKAGAVHRLAGWVYLAASATATITLTDNGSTPVVKVLTLVAGTGGIGAAGWFSFPRYGYDDLSIETASDATSVTIALEAAANTTVDFSDIQLVQGPQADPDLWEPAPEDIESAPGLGNLVKTLYSTAVQTATGANLNLTTLHTYTLAAGLLARDGDSITARAWGSFAANANIKTIAGRMGAAATIIATNDVTPAPNGTAWSIEFKLTYRSAISQTVVGQAMVGAVAQSVVNTLGANAMANTLQIGVTGQNGVAAANDIVCDGFTVEYHPMTP